MLKKNKMSDRSGGARKKALDSFPLRSHSPFYFVSQTLSPSVHGPPGRMNKRLWSVELSHLTSFKQHCEHQ